MDYHYNFRQIDAIQDEGGCWIWNDSFLLSNPTIEYGKEEAFLMDKIIPQRRSEYEVTWDGDVYELCCIKEDMRPILALLPQIW